MRSRLARRKSFRKMALFPAVIRDISLLLREEIPLRDVFELAGRAGGGLLKELKLSDVYKGEQISAGYKGLTISCVYRLEEKTLIESEVAPAHAAVVQALSGHSGISLR